MLLKRNPEVRHIKIYLCFSHTLSSVRGPYTMQLINHLYVLMLKLPCTGQFIHNYVIYFRGQSLSSKVNKMGIKNWVYLVSVINKQLVYGVFYTEYLYLSKRLLTSVAPRAFRIHQKKISVIKHNPKKGLSERASFIFQEA